MEEKQLMIGEWPNIAPTTTLEVSPNRDKDEDPRLVKARKKSPRQSREEPEPQSQQLTSQKAESGGPDFGILTEQEKYNPFAPEVCFRSRFHSICSVLD